MRALIISVFVQPRASREGFVGMHGDELKLAVNAPPVDGAANEACILFLSKYFGVSKSKVTLLRGDKNRHKQFQIEGDRDTLISKLQGIDGFRIPT